MPHSLLMMNTNTNESLLASNTENVPAGTPVTIRIGSDRYAGVVVRSTARSMVVRYTVGGLSGDEHIRGDPRERLGDLAV